MSIIKPYTSFEDPNLKHYFASQRRLIQLRKFGLVSIARLLTVIRIYIDNSVNFRSTKRIEFIQRQSTVRISGMLREMKRLKTRSHKYEPKSKPFSIVLRFTLLGSTKRFSLRKQSKKYAEQQTLWHRKQDEERRKRVQSAQVNDWMSCTSSNFWWFFLTWYLRLLRQNPLLQFAYLTSINGLRGWVVIIVQFSLLLYC